MAVLSSDMTTVRSATGTVRSHAVPLLMLSVLLAGVGGCSDNTPAPLPSPTVSRSPASTIGRLEVGDRIILTAAVDRRLDPQAFVLRDADLPAAGLLVLDRGAAGAAPPQLVTVHGMINRFSYAAHAAGYELHDPAAYRLFEDVKVLIADRVEIRD